MLESTEMSGDDGKDGWTDRKMDGWVGARIDEGSEGLGSLYVRLVCY